MVRLASRREVRLPAQSLAPCEVNILHKFPDEKSTIPDVKVEEIPFILGKT